MGLFNSNTASRYIVKGNYFSSHPEIKGYKNLELLFENNGVTAMYKKKPVRSFGWNEVVGFDADDQVTQSNSKRVAATIRDILRTTTGDILLEGHVQGGSPTSLMGSSANLSIVMHTKSSNNVKRFVSERATGAVNANVVGILSDADELAKFSKLKESGVISAEEFEQKKNQLLRLS